MDDAALPVVYADESNNTGENLQDRDQPVFTVAGVHLDDDRAHEIVEVVTAAMQQGAGEPKYSRLSRRPRGRTMLMSAFDALPDDSVKVFVADKKFMTVSKIVDLGIEPLAFADGYNMHADESARALAHLAALVGPVVGDSQKFDDVLAAFIASVTQHGHADAERYVSAAEEYLVTVDSGSESILRMALLPTTGWLAGILAERTGGLHPDTLDPAIPSIVAVCRAFFEIVGPFRLVHDKSDVIERHTNLLLNIEQLPDPTDPSCMMETAGVKRIDFGDSKAIAQLKIADWVAGATRDVAMSKLNPPRKTVSHKLSDIVDGWLAAPPLWPDQGWLADRLGLSNLS